MTITSSTLSPPLTLYHYCRIESFMAILENKTLRMSRLSSMNDYMEHGWLRQTAINRLNVLRKENPRSVLDSSEASAPSRFVSAVLLQLTTVSHIDPYCVCFSEEGDVLSQWRAYADDGRGFAIGFNFASLDNFSYCKCERVTYDQREHERIVEELIEKYRSELPADPSDDQLREIASAFHSELLAPSMYCKNPKFSEEQEWRVVHEPILVEDPAAGKTSQIGPASSSGFWVRDGQLLHYLEVAFNPEFREQSINHIVLGPKNPAYISSDPLNLFLQEKGFEHVEVKMSEATYR